MDKYEKEMIDVVNRHAEEKKQGFGTLENTTAKKSLFTKTDAKNLGRGVKRMVVALLTTATFAISVYCFIVAAIVIGYWAVGLFLAGIVLMVCAFTLLYAQGITHTEGKGDDK